jgi:hypothetical protein
MVQIHLTILINPDLSQVTYDLAQVNHTNQLALRDTLLTALETYSKGPRNIIVQLSLAIIGLALQVPSWEQPVQTLIEKFGTNPTTVPTLLEFLTLLPEEVNGNIRIPISVSPLCYDLFDFFNIQVRMNSFVSEAPSY